MLFLCQSDLLPRKLNTTDLSLSITPLLSKVFEEIVAGKLSNFLKSNSLLLASQSSYRRCLGMCDALLTLSHHLHVALNSGIDGRLVQLDFSAASDRVSTRVLWYKLRSIGIGKSACP